MKKAALILILFCFACSSKPKTPTVHIIIADSGRSIEFKGLDYAITSEISRDSVPGIWQGLIPVYRMPADTDMKDYQKPLPGVYLLKDSAVVFTPDTPFVKNQIYFVRYFKFEGGNDSWDIIRGKKKLGKTPYTDLIFKQ